MNKVLIISGLFLVLVAGYSLAIKNADSDNAYAYGDGSFRGNRPGYERMFSDKADMFDMTVDELKTELETKTFHEIVEENGITLDEFKNKVREQATERWQNVGFTEEEINERLQRMEERHENCEEGSGGPYGQGGKGMMLHK